MQNSKHREDKAEEGSAVPVKHTGGLHKLLSLPRTKGVQIWREGVFYKSGNRWFLCGLHFHLPFSQGHRGAQTDADLEKSRPFLPLVNMSSAEQGATTAVLFPPARRNAHRTHRLQTLVKLSIEITSLFSGITGSPTARATHLHT